MESVERNQPQCVELRLHSDKTRRPRTDRDHNSHVRITVGQRRTPSPYRTDIYWPEVRATWCDSTTALPGRPAVDDDDTIRADVPLMYNDKRSVGMSLDSASLFRHTLSKTLSAVNMSTLLCFFVCFFNTFFFFYFLSVQNFWVHVSIMKQVSDARLPMVTISRPQKRRHSFYTPREGEVTFVPSEVLQSRRMKFILWSTWNTVFFFSPNG